MDPHSDEPRNPDTARDAGPASRLWVVCAAAVLIVLLCVACVAAPLVGANGLPLRRFDQGLLNAGWRVAAERVEVLPDGVRATPGPDGVVAIESPPLDISADVSPTPVLVLSGPAIAGRFGYELSWRRAGDERTYRLSVRTSAQADPSARVAYRIDDMVNEAGWKGRVTQLTWQLKVGEAPVEVRGVGVPAATSMELARVLWRQWWYREQISARTINSIMPPHVLGFAPNTLLATAAVATIAGLAAIRAARKGDMRLHGRTITIVIAGAWVVNDVRWMVGQGQQLRRDDERFSKARTRTEQIATLPELEDSPRFMELVQATLPPGAVYAVAGSYWSPSHPNLRYFLSPRAIQVNLDPVYPLVPLERAEYVLILPSPDVRFDPQTGEFSAPRFPSWRLELVAGPADGRCIARRIDMER